MLASAESVRVKLWDLPVRITHWSFVALLPALWWTWKSGEMATHRLLGYGMLGLLIFRLFWGFAGSATARFATFVKGPRAVGGYMSRLFANQGEPVIGHNPLGALSVLALLGTLIAQVCLGLFTQDVDGIESGPLTYLVSYDTADAARHWHGLLFDALLWLVGIHMCAILLYLVVKRDNLVGPMISGHKRWPMSAPPNADTPAWRMIAGIVIAVAIAWWVSQGCPIGR